MEDHETSCTDCGVVIKTYPPEDGSGLFRCGHCSGTGMAASTSSPATQQVGRQYALYRFFDADGVLLYIGLSVDIPARFKKHGAEKPWWSEVARIALEPFPDLASVQAAEKRAIQSEQPRWNIQHTRRHVEPWTWRCTLTSAPCAARQYSSPTSPTGSSTSTAATTATAG